MKLLKIVFIGFAFLLSLTTFSYASICLGQTATLNYTSSNVPGGQGCAALVVPPGFSSPGAPPANTSGFWPIFVPLSASAGAQNFSLSCAT